MKATDHILCVGVTPCMQRTLRFHHLIPGQVNRAVGVSLEASGKGTNVCRVVKTLGGNPRMITLLGGAPGEDFQARIQTEGLTADIVPSAGVTRTCQTLIDLHHEQVTELVEEAPTPSPEEWAALDQAVVRQLPRASVQLLSGRLPPGSPADTYARWISSAHAAGVPTFVDSQLDALVLAVAAKPFLVKINADELVASFPGDGEAQAGLQHGIDEIREAGVSWVLITRGGKSALLVGEEGTWRYSMPDLRVVNPIGSGDATLAGTAWGVQQGMNFPDAAAYGLACGCANVLTEAPGRVRLQDVERLYEPMKPQRQ